jgi:hypothetical protein
VRLLEQHQHDEIRHGEREHDEQLVARAAQHVSFRESAHRPDGDRRHGGDQQHRIEVRERAEHGRGTSAEETPRRHVVRQQERGAARARLRVRREELGKERRVCDQEDRDERDECRRESDERASAVALPSNGMRDGERQQRGDSVVQDRGRRAARETGEQARAQRALACRFDRRDDGEHDRDGDHRVRSPLSREAEVQEARGRAAGGDERPAARHEAPREQPHGRHDQARDGRDAAADEREVARRFRELRFEFRFRAARLDPRQHRRDVRERGGVRVVETALLRNLIAVDERAVLRVVDDLVEVREMRQLVVDPDPRQRETEHRHRDEQDDVLPGRRGDFEHRENRCQTPFLQDEPARTGSGTDFRAGEQRRDPLELRALLGREPADRAQELLARSRQGMAGSKRGEAECALSQARLAPLRGARGFESSQPLNRARFSSWARREAARTRDR